MSTTNLIEDLRLLTPPRYGVWLALVLSAILILALWLILRRRPGAECGTVVDSTGPEPWALALSELERLTHLLASEHSREYAIQSTGVLRRFIEARYSLRAPKLTTEEFLVAAGQAPELPADHRARLRRFLELCDLLKFGRYRATTGELATLHEAAVTFVMASRPSSLPERPPEAQKC
jgi:hypothetical protein